MAGGKTGKERKKEGLSMVLKCECGNPDYNEESWVSQELFTHLYEQFKLKIKGGVLKNV